jgi:hypothetical protein
MSKKEMIAFLCTHFRYDTMNSWNRATSYAHNLKIHKVIPRELQDTAYELIEQGDIYHAINNLIEEFNAEYEYAYQAGFNGRSGGYLVMYQGGKKQSEQKSYCTECNQTNFTDVSKGNICGKCGEKARVNYDTFSYPGKGIDSSDPEEWQDASLESIKDRVRLVKRFDRLAKDIIKLTIAWCKKYTVEDKTITVPKTIKVLAQK